MRAPASALPGVLSRDPRCDRFVDCTGIVGPLSVSGEQAETQASTSQEAAAAAEETAASAEQVAATAQQLATNASRLETLVVGFKT